MSLLIETDLAKHQALYGRMDIDSLSPTEILTALKHAKLKSGGVEIKLSRETLAKLLNIDKHSIDPICMSFSTPFAIKRRSSETKIILGDLKDNPNATLLTALKNARFWLDELRIGKSLAEIAQNTELSSDHIRKSIRLGLVSPNIQKAILSGNHPDHWSVSLFTRSALPMNWAEQESLFFA
jgi:hypothetical protein